MRYLYYTILPGVGPGKVPADGTVVDLLFALPYFIGFGWPFPSHAQLDSLLRQGYEDAGMSGGAEWDPFELREDEYAEVVRVIAQDERLASRPVPSFQGSAAFAREI